MDSAGPNELSWLGSSAYQRLLKTTQAGAVLVPRSCAVPEGLTVIRVDDPDLAACQVQRWLSPDAPAPEPGIHPSAVVDPSARVDGVSIGAHVFIGPGVRIGAGTRLHPGVYIGSDVQMGRDCVLWPNVVVRERVIIGDRVVIHPNATIGADGFGYLLREGRQIKIPQTGTVVIEDDVEIGANAAVDRARFGQTRIARGTKIDNLVQIAHNVQIGEHCVIAGQSGISGSSRLGRGVVLAGQVGVADHLCIGDAAVVAAKSGVVRNIPKRQTVRGIPAVPVWEFGRQQVALRRLPKLIEQVRELARRVQQLESAADHPARG